MSNSDAALPTLTSNPIACDTANETTSGDTRNGTTAHRNVSRISPDFQAQLQMLRATYASRLPEKLARLEEACALIHSAPEQTESNAALDLEALKTAHRLAHNLTGSGATYGFDALSRAARTLEHQLKAFMVRGEDSVEAPVEAPLEAPVAPFTVQERALIQQHFKSLKAVSLQSGESLSAMSLDFDWQQAESSPWDYDGNHSIFLVTDNPALTSDLVRQISHFGYAVRVFSSRDDITQNAVNHHADGNTSRLGTRVELERAALQTPPSVLVVDTGIDASITQIDASTMAQNDDGGVLKRGGQSAVVPDTTESNAGLKIVRAIQDARRAAGTETLPVVFIAARGDIDSRLRAVRAGGAAYFTRPVDAAEIIDKLDTLTAHEAPDPYRVLIVDDEPSLGSFYAWTLNGSGMSTHVVDDPTRIMPALNDFRPDLILMDVYMPHCSGLELATVIRQQSDYVSVPIVFLSAETDVEKQLAAMNLGGDDFLTKPIQPEHLVSSVTARARRSRDLRSLMVRDSLTGLLNHTTTKEHIEIEVARAHRSDMPLSFAMIDIDNFKSINDTHGHLAGDRVIKNLARLLTQRLRKTDTVGRYGGEEFAVILPDTDGPTAQRVLEQLRIGFSQIKQQAAGVEFSVTLSGGIATFPACPDAPQINDHADKALYEAKRTGRNRIVLAADCA